MTKYIYKDEGHARYTPTGPGVVTLPTPNPDYPSCPLGMRVTDLPRGWASAGVKHTYLWGKSWNAGGDNPKAKLSRDDVSTIRLLHSGGESASSIARGYGVAKTTITRLVKGETWKL